MNIITCPFCNSNNLADIFYGMPVIDEDLEQQLNEKKIVLGGCCVSSFSPSYHCNQCGKEWNQRNYEVNRILAEAKVLAKRYYELTGKPLGITGEIAEYEAARLLGLNLCDAREEGFDAVKEIDGTHQRIQIKGRCLPPKCNPGQRIGRIDINKEWDLVYLVILDMNFETQVIYEAEREKVIKALVKPGSRSRNLRHAMSITKFKSIGNEIWKKQLDNPL